MSKNRRRGADLLEVFLVGQLGILHRHIVLGGTAHSMASYPQASSPISRDTSTSFYARVINDKRCKVPVFDYLVRSSNRRRMPIKFDF